jgi:hypothetical protein
MSFCCSRFVGHWPYLRSRYPLIHVDLKSAILSHRVFLSDPTAQRILGISRDFGRPGTIKKTRLKPVYWYQSGEWFIQVNNYEGLYAPPWSVKKALKILQPFRFAVRDGGDGPFETVEDGRVPSTEFSRPRNWALSTGPCRSTCRVTA